VVWALGNEAFFVPMLHSASVGLDWHSSTNGCARAVIFCRCEEPVKTFLGPTKFSLYLCVTLDGGFFSISESA
jgi:hypothetical protein